jgi:hypothetical protein
MALWSDELEAMRPQLREEADAFISSFASEPDDPSLPVPEGPHGCIGMPSVLERWFPHLTDFLRRAISG